MSSNDSQRPLMIKVWIGLLILTLIEVFLAYVQLGQTLMLILLMVFSFVKAAMIVGYFMHLKFDRPALGWMLMPPTIAMMVVLFAYLLPDAYIMLGSGQ